ncbi:uncharacterized protein FOMMEDRAFT_159791 [Fomitiporia mediterranea MF3/22]|uniref:uncharacterized protein n=1 Tax=Fomitiporia mediterranea (strain MF3/22) TaxID=694068 RepID=UPI0004407DE2|nr:uncharacterized protein FOMMEDRAFT_159791 [Fomitiporia mediterranea MF3/22]EJD00145.1 hypothetical protein FOMMEDRAFT_159791 [Fomitiporia mediterranea MF3/22]
MDLLPRVTCWSAFRSAIDKRSSDWTCKDTLGDRRPISSQIVGHMQSSELRVRDRIVLSLDVKNLLLWRPTFSVRLQFKHRITPFAMSNAKQVNPFDDSPGQTSPLLNQGQEHAAGQPRDIRMGETQTLDGPPVYQHPYFSNEDKHSSAPTLVQQPAVAPVGVASCAASVRSRAISAATEAEWYETLRELQENLTDLRRARKRTSRLATISRVTPQCLRPRNHGVDESAREARVLEELVLAGMRRLAIIHPDPLVQAEWDSRAEQFSRSMHYDDDGTAADEGAIALDGAESVAAGDLEGARAQRSGRRIARLVARDEKDTMLMGLAKGVGILLFTPVALAGAGVFGAGVMLYASGKIVVELGHMMTFGRLR